MAAEILSPSPTELTGGAGLPSQRQPVAIELASVKDIIHLGSQDHGKRGFVEIYGYIMNDGNFFEVHNGEPAERKTDLPLWSFPALGTGSEGHNKVGQLNVMGLGIPVAAVGPCNATTLVEGLQYLPEHPQKINLCGVAHAMHAIMKEAVVLNFYKEDQVMAAGESQGGMKALAIKATEKLYGNKVVYTQAVAPVLPRHLRKGDYPGIGLQWGIVEPISILRNLARLPLSDLVRHRQTLARGKAYKESRKQFMPVLTSGEVGDAARMIGEDADIDITLFTQDYMSQPHIWPMVLPKTEYPSVAIEVINGSHMTVISKGVGSKRSLAKIEAAQDRLGF